MIGHRLMGPSLLFTGNLAESRTHLDRALALYDPVEHRALATRFALDPGVCGSPPSRSTISRRRRAHARRLGCSPAAEKNCETTSVLSVLNPHRAYPLKVCERRCRILIRAAIWARRPPSGIYFSGSALLSAGIHLDLSFLVCLVEAERPRAPARRDCRTER